MPLTPDEFSGKVALVTGAGRGVGRALALALASCGARTAVNDLTPTHAEQTVERILAAGGEGRAFWGDVARPMTARALVSQVLEVWGRIDILVNNAAVAPHAPLMGMDEWDWQRTLDVNLSGPLWVMQAAASAMQSQGGGAVLNIAGTPAWAVALPDAGAYAATQAALLALTQSAAAELAADDIRVNALCFGAVEPGAGTTGTDAPRLWQGLGVPLARVVERAVELCRLSGPGGQVIMLEQGD